MQVTRRKVGQLLLAASALSYSRLASANDRLNIGFIGLNSRGQGLLSSFLNVGTISVKWLCDVDRKVLEASLKYAREAGQTSVRGSSDWRELLNDPSLDAVVIATPDHWHAYATITALNAGKHVYVEKPLSQTPAEGEALVAAQARTGLVVQMGNQQRSALESIELTDRIGSGELGEVYAAETWYGNARESIERGTVVPPPEHLDWALWQGPRPKTDFRTNVVHYNWHWFWRWGTGELCNNAAHELDVARWAMGLSYPQEIQVRGGRLFHRDDDWEMYDTLEAGYYFDSGKSITWSGHSCNRVERFGRGRGVLLLGTKGQVIVDRAGFEWFDIDRKPVMQRKSTGRAVNTSDLVGAGALTEAHIANFLQAVRGQGGALHSPASEGHISTMLCHLGNIAYRSGQQRVRVGSSGHLDDQSLMELYWQAEMDPDWKPLTEKTT